MKTNNVNGFTLIEVLVVVSIIGLLTSITYKSVSDSRAKANDVKVKQQLSQIRNVVAQYYLDNNLSYGIAVVGNEGVIGIIGSGCGSGMFGSSLLLPFLISNLYPSGDGAGKCTVPSGGQGFTVSYRLSSGNYWCVDGKGTSRSIGASFPANSAPACP